MHVITRLGPGLWTFAALALWAVLAARSPDLTYHFAPLIAAGVWPVMSGRAAAAVASGGVTLLVSIGLALAGWLEGPDFFGGHAAFGEAALFAVAGAALGAAWAIARSAVPRAGQVS